MRDKHKRLHTHTTSPGIAIGQVRRINPPKLLPTKTWIRDEDVNSEIERFKQALNLSIRQLLNVQSKLSQFQKTDQLGILESQRLLLQDDMLIKTTIEHITAEKINAEWALDKTLSQIKLSFMNLDEDFFKEKKQDLEYIGKQLISNLSGETDSHIETVPEGEWILIARDISPADIATFPHERVKGFIMEVGGKTSHSAIIARSLGIPALFSIENALAAFDENDKIILDGLKGIAIANPTPAELNSYKAAQNKYQALESLLMQDTKLAAETKDGKTISIFANIELVDEIPSVIQHGAEGVGLYRTEYLFLNRVEEPSEDEQIENYSLVLKALNPKPVVIRTVDLGGDKLPKSSRYNKQTNPALGLRSIRLCLRERPMFKRQLRALYQASPHGNLKILLPLISNVEEVRAVKKIIAEVKNELIAQNKTFVENIPLGIMIEVPAAVFIADLLAKESDFFSIGTNDLIQYGLAIDRVNELVSYLYTPFHPSIIRMVKQVANVAKEHNIPFSLCGELAADPFFIPLLLGLGFDSLSMNPASIPFAKKIIRSIDIKKIQNVVENAMTYSTASEVEEYLKKEFESFIPANLQKFGTT
ncbi:MAG: phosphoenolpyruvate--protein phosphotransferase [Pseudomonadota bacterium]